MADKSRKRKADAANGDRERCLKAVKLQSWALGEAGDIHKADKEIVLAAVQQDREEIIAYTDTVQDTT
eukprot:4989702-Amphidinium_carterae.1